MKRCATPPWRLRRRAKNPLVFWKEEEAIPSIDLLVERADIIYLGHDRAFHVVNGEIEYLEETKMTAAGMDPEDPNIAFDFSPRPIWIMPGIEDQTLERLG